MISFLSFFQQPFSCGLLGARLEYKGGGGVVSGLEQFTAWRGQELSLQALLLYFDKFAKRLCHGA